MINKHYSFVAKTVATILLASTVNLPLAYAKKEQEASIPYSNETLEKIEQAAQQRMATFKMHPSLALKMWANEAQTHNPAFFTFDEKGQMLMAEIYRFNDGVFDVRGLGEFTARDVTTESLDDRLAIMKDQIKTQSKYKSMEVFTKTSDKIRLLADTNNDGKADMSKIFAEDFNQPLSGLGSGLVTRDGKVYYTNIPDLWQLEDTDNDGVADKRESLQSGFGLRIGFLGHDMHGLTWGPDGKLYWSIGDRGYSLVTKEGNKFHGPNMGAVFRADPDGSNLEEFYIGLRNPQELAFDKYGNLFTADNDGDGGDKERIVNIVEGGDSGWHGGHQSIISFSDRLKLRSQALTSGTMPVAWLTEDRWHPRNDKQPAFLLPTLGHLEGGPSGFVFNPSDMLGKEFNDSFLVVVFKGAAVKTHIASFKINPDGAGFSVSYGRNILSGMNATDADFGPDGKLYVSEYNYGSYTALGKGGVYSITPQKGFDEQESKRIKKILTSDFNQYSVAQLTAFLSDKHQKVRQRAQFQLAKKGDAGKAVFSQQSNNQNADEMARIHSIWGLGQLAQQAENKAAYLQPLFVLANDKNAQIRIQALKVLGDAKYQGAGKLFQQKLLDSNKQVAMYAAIGLGKIDADFAIKNVIKALRDNADQDLWLRHGLVMALAGQDKKHWLNYKNDGNDSVRLAVLLALRKHKDNDLAYFLQDTNKKLVNEAIIAINDLGLVEVMPQLAAVLDKYINAANSLLPHTDVDKIMHHRLINANYSLGTAVAAERILKYAATPTLDGRLIEEALAAIEAWQDVGLVDSTTGLKSTANLNRENINKVVNKRLQAVLKNASGQGLAQAIRLAEQYQFSVPEATLLAALADNTTSLSVRKEALASLKAKKSGQLSVTVESLLNDTDVEIRALSLQTLYQLAPNKGLNYAQQFLKRDSIFDQQAALRTLTTGKGKIIDSISKNYLQLLLENKLATGLVLETLDLARSRRNAEIKALVNKYDTALEKANVTDKFSGALAGGNVAKGKHIFSAGGAAECQRCHMINKQGSRVGPDLSVIGKNNSADYLLRALVDPSADIASGFGTMTLTLTDGTTTSGIFINENDKTITLEVKKKNKSFNKSQISQVQRPMSGMPPMGYLLTPYQIRDVIAYLSSLKKRPAKVFRAH